VSVQLVTDTVNYISREISQRIVILGYSLSSVNIYSELKKLCHCTFVHNFDSVGQFSKFYHCCVLQEICNKTYATLLTTS